MNAPSVSAVVVSFNGGERVLTCVEALLGQSSPLAEIIVVDNHSTDGSVQRVRERFPAVRILELDENRGPSAARNAGLRSATSELVWLIDSDVYPDEDCLSHLLCAFGRVEAPTVVCPRIRLIPERDVVQADGAASHFVGTMVLRHGYLPLADASDEAGLVPGCGSGCLLVDRERVLRVGGFDEAYFFYFEDLEFSVRLGALGHRIVCEPAAVAFHDRQSGIEGLSYRGQGSYPRRRAYLTLRNRLLTVLVHYRVRTLLLLLPALALYELACLATVLLRGWGREWVRAWRWQLLNISAIRQRRRRVQRARLRNDRDLLVGGPLPLAPGFARSRVEALAGDVLSSTLNSYWNVARRFIG